MPERRDDGGVGPVGSSVPPLLREVLDDSRWNDRPLPASVAGFRILGELGRGGMGVVFRAEQPRPLREVALKVVRPSRSDETTRRRFDLEIEVLGRLEHPGIASILQAGTLTDGQAWFAMELVDGDPLDVALRRRRMHLLERVRLVEQVADAVAHAHARGVVHRDLSPSNVLVDRRGRPRLIDFGLARTIGDRALPLRSVHSEPGHLAGTVPFLSPEQARGRGDAIDARTDVFGLGGLLYFALTGRPPVDLDGVPLTRVLAVIEGEEPTPPSWHARGVPPALDAVCLRALSRDPAARHPSARAFADDLRCVLEGRTPHRAPRRVLARVGQAWPGLAAALLVASLSMIVAQWLDSVPTATSGFADWDQDFHRLLALGCADEDDVARHLAEVERRSPGASADLLHCLWDVAREDAWRGELGVAHERLARLDAVLDRDPGPVAEVMRGLVLATRIRFAPPEGEPPMVEPSSGPAPFVARAPGAPGPPTAGPGDEPGDGGVAGATRPQARRTASVLDGAGFAMAGARPALPGVAEVRPPRVADAGGPTPTVGPSPLAWMTERLVAPPSGSRGDTTARGRHPGRAPRHGAGGRLRERLSDAWLLSLSLLDPLDGPELFRQLEFMHDADVPTEVLVGWWRERHRLRAAGSGWGVSSARVTSAAR